ncbi:MAG: UDP-N-acetylglucosamine--N-acetylmuramyl-(pentapeptide) pyrophosphoryl-undecaprenol N-acetylglucosamine transferase [Nitrososphaerota archaeon]
MPKIHLGVCGIGFGHASRAVQIAEAIKERGWGFSISSYGEGLEYLKRFGLDVYKVPEVSYGVLHEGKVSIKMTIFKNILLPVRVLEQTSYELSLIDKDTDVVISDTRASTVIAAKMLGKPVLTILNQFNVRILYPRYRWVIESLEAASYLVGWIWLRSDRILIADYPPPLTISKETLTFPEDTKVRRKVKYIGPIVESSVKKLVDVGDLRRKYGIGLDGKPVILFKATGPFYERQMLIKKMTPILEKLDREFEVVVTSGGLHVDSPKRESNLRIYEWVEDPLELVRISDVVITRAGQTTLAKILALGKPVLMIPIPGHAEQYGNASSVEENNAGVKLDEESLNEETLRETLNRLLDCKFRKNAQRYSEAFKLSNPIKWVLEEIELILDKADR